VPIDSTPVERLLWSPTLRKVHLDSPHFRRTIRPLTAPTVAFAFDFRAGAPSIKPERVRLDLPLTQDGRANGVVFWFEMPLGAAGVISNAPLAAMPTGARHLSLGQALQYLQPVPVSAGATLSLDASHNRTRILFSPLEPDGHPTPLPHPRRGLVLGEQLRTLQDAALNRPLAAAVRKALFRLPANKPALVLHVGAGIGTQSVVAAQARPDVADYVVACEKSATLIDVAERVAQLNSVGGRISFLQKDCRNLKAHEDMPHKADVLVLECLDTALLSEGILHYVQHLRGTFTAEHAAIIPAAGVVKGMLIELRSGEVHGVDMTMADAYRWSKEARPVHLRDDEYTQLSDVFDIFVFDFASSALEQQVSSGARMDRGRCWDDARQSQPHPTPHPHPHPQHLRPRFRLSAPLCPNDGGRCPHGAKQPSSHY
jgi:SAM-dependent methyltransferase